MVFGLDFEFSQIPCTHCTLPNGKDYVSLKCYNKLK
jgi:hypothetical protein